MTIESVEPPGPPPVITQISVKTRSPLMIPSVTTMVVIGRSAGSVT